MSSVTTYARQKATVKRLLRRFGGGAACTLHKPEVTVTDPDRPWDPQTDPATDYPGIACVFLPTDFRYDMSAGFWPDSIIPEARAIALVSAPDLPDSVDMREGWQLTRQDGKKVSILRANVYKPDGINKLLYIAQVTG